MTGFLIAGTSSGVGKTTVTLALLAALRRRGLRAQPFKGGPDFLDTGHHTRIAGRPARNLDTWMLSPQANLDVVAQATCDADALLVEGMMGLFDGKTGDSEAGSSAELAKLLQLPVVLVLDASKSARSLAAVVLGFERFDPALPLAGVVLNRVAGERHYDLLATAIQTNCKTPILGWLPRDPAIAIPERHLGLHTAEESSTDDIITQQNALADLAESHLDIARLMAHQCGLDLRQPAPAPTQAAPTVRIGVAHDRAFSFYYEDNLDLLRAHGAEIVPFSPLADTALPPALDALYLGGGYPELHAAALSANTPMLQAVRAFAASNRPIYAECGGMLYLAETLTTTDGLAHPMAAVLPMHFTMTPKLVDFGYVTVELTADCLLGPAGTTLRGHSFHYSRMSGDCALPTAYAVEFSLSRRRQDEGFRHRNVLASYIHLHFRAAPSIAEHFVRAAQTASLVTT